MIWQYFIIPIITLSVWLWYRLFGHLLFDWWKEEKYRQNVRQGILDDNTFPDRKGK
jgi:hypothetical protein